MSRSIHTSPAADEIRRYIGQARLGDAHAVELLLEGCRPRLKQMVRLRMDSRLSARLDPSDVIQEAFVTATQQLNEYLRNEPIPFYPWLRRITWQKLVHTHEQHLDAQKRTVRQEQRDDWVISDASVACFARLIDVKIASPSGVVMRRERRRRVRAALAELPELDREVLLQRYVEQLSAKEIAAGLGTSEAAVHMRHMRALEKLRRLLGDAVS